jgi:hypothetical protein
MNTSFSVLQEVEAEWVFIRGLASSQSTTAEGSELELHNGSDFGAP